VSRRPRTWLTSCVLAAGVVTGCYSFAQPSYHPGDPRDVLVALERRGVAVQSAVAGESACPDPGLVDNVVHLRATLGDDAAPRDLYLYTFRPRRWDGSKDTVDACQAAYAAANAGAHVTRLDIPTYRALGADWSPAFATAVEEALVEASSQGEQ
jgi:hypothetical protein